MKKKHIPYYAVLDALVQNNCPVCFLAAKSIENYFESLLFEDINDVGFRKKFNEQSGFCNFHSYKFLKYNDGLAISLTHKDLLVQKIIQYKNIKNILSIKKNTQKKCIICEISEDAEKGYISIIIEYIDDEEFKNKFSGSDGLCIPHFEITTSKLSSIPKWFFDFHKSKYAVLLKQINKFIDSCNFSLGDKRPAITEEEKDVCKKAVKILFGYEGMKLNRPNVEFFKKYL